MRRTDKKGGKVLLPPKKPNAQNSKNGKIPRPKTNRKKKKSSKVLTSVFFFKGIFVCSQSGC
jgi:hypothetical protein